MWNSAKELFVFVFLVIKKIENEHFIEISLAIQEEKYNTNLGITFGGVLSTSQAAKSFIGTGLDDILSVLLADILTPEKFSSSKYEQFFKNFLFIYTFL